MSIKLILRSQYIVKSKVTTTETTLNFILTFLRYTHDVIGRHSLGKNQRERH